jgi:hypothetical protein
MLAVPEKYLQTLMSDLGCRRDLTKATLRLIQKSTYNLHFIIDEKEVDLTQIICGMCSKYSTNSTNIFDFKVGQRVIKHQHPKYICTITELEQTPRMISESHVSIQERIDSYIPLTTVIHNAGTVKKRISEFKNFFNAQKREDFFNNEKLLVVGSKKLFRSLPLDYPACFAEQGENGEIEIGYSSPLLPKIAFLKNVDLLERYLEQEINGEHIVLGTCIFIGSSKYEHSINMIRNYYQQKILRRIIFIGDKDQKINLGNAEIPLRWKWTIPEIKYFTNTPVVHPQFLVVHNSLLKEAVELFHNLVIEIERMHTISLRSLFRFVRRLYYDWCLEPDSNTQRLKAISDDFEATLEELLVETFCNINPDFDIHEYKTQLSLRFEKIIHSVKSNNKTQYLKAYKNIISQLIVPSFLRANHTNELNCILKQCQKRAPAADNLMSLGDLEIKKREYWSDTTRDYFSLTPNHVQPTIVSFAKSNDSDGPSHKIIASIYRTGTIEKIIKRLGLAATKYYLLVYSIEKEAFDYHLYNYVSDLNYEYASKDRYKICGVEFVDPFYQYTTFDQLIEALAQTHSDDIAPDLYKITFTDNSRSLKLPSTKSVLKIVGTEKHVVTVEDLEHGDKVQIYENPDKTTLQTIVKLEDPDMMRKADEYSLLWQQCLREYCIRNFISEIDLYYQLINNRFSVKLDSLKRYMQGEVTFPRKKIDLIAIAKTINDRRLNLDFVKNTILPFMHEYNGEMVKYGFKFSNSINNFLQNGEMDEFLLKWYSHDEVQIIVSQIPQRTIKDIELSNLKSVSDD